MFYYLFTSESVFINIFRYITFRSLGAALTALLLTLWLGPVMINKLRTLYPKGQPIREDGPALHLTTKKGTPTMGGVLILAALTLSVLLWADLTNAYIWLVLFVTLSMGGMGFIDDYLKVSKANTKGISAKGKLLFQILVSLVVCFGVQRMSIPEYASHITIPVWKEVAINLGYYYWVFVLMVIVGSSNAVNLTDGLDGLAIGTMLIATSCFAVICYLVGNHIFADYLQVWYVPGAGELTVFCAALIGAGLGFLWYNAPPARIFMGDTGSLALGSSLGAVSVVTKHELLLAIIGGVFVLEAVSVMLQVGYFKLTKGKRIFLMAPLHHHFEKKGWVESQVVIRFWILAIIFAILGMATLKIR